MTLIAEQMRPWTQARWEALCWDAAMLIASSPCLLCGPRLGPTLIEPSPAADGLGLHADAWNCPGHPVMLWPLEPLPYSARIALPPDGPYTHIALMLLLRAVHHAGDQTLSLKVTADLSSAVLKAGQALGGPPAR